MSNINGHDILTDQMRSSVYSLVYEFHWRKFLLQQAKRVNEKPALWYLGRNLHQRKCTDNILILTLLWSNDYQLGHCVIGNAHQFKFWVFLLFTDENFAREGSNPWMEIRRKSWRCWSVDDFAIHQSLLRHNLVYNCGFLTLSCFYSFGIQPMRPKFCVALVTRYDLLS